MGHLGREGRCLDSIGLGSSSKVQPDCPMGSTQSCRSSACGNDHFLGRDWSVLRYSSQRRSNWSHDQPRQGCFLENHQNQADESELDDQELGTFRGSGLPCDCRSDGLPRCSQSFQTVSGGPRHRNSCCLFCLDPGEPDYGYDHYRGWKHLVRCQDGFGGLRTRQGLRNVDESDPVNHEHRLDASRDRRQPRIEPQALDEDPSRRRR